MRAALYARYSSDRQNERSIEDQLELARRHAEARGWTVVAEFCDAAISGAAMANRPGLNALLAAGDAHSFDVVLVEDTDRLARDREHDAHIYKRLSFAGISISTFTVEKVGVIESTLKGLMNELYLVQLSEKTMRGMRSNAEKGLATGAKLYGYETKPGGDTSIVEEQAEVIRRAFTLFADYQLSGREIADAFNRDRIPGPRSGYWNASTLLGSRERGNGILRSEIYAGVKVWGRDEVVKDPQTGKRLHRFKPPEEWQRTPVEHLRIVPQDLWDRAKARHETSAKISLSQHGNKRKPGLFSGLLKCGVCGSSYTSYRRGQLLCAGHRERGPSVCSNSKIVDRELVERRALDGIEQRMLSPEAAAIYVRAYHAAWQKIEREKSDRRRPLEKRLAELTRSIERLVDAICDGTATPAMNERLQAQEAEKAQIAAELANTPEAEPAIALHAGAAEFYSNAVRELRAWIEALAADPAAEAPSRKAMDDVRALIDRIEIVPNPRGKGGVDLRLCGNLALLLTPAENEKASNVAAGGSRVAGFERDPSSLAAGIPLVAGGGIGRAPPTFPAVFTVPLEEFAA